MKKLIKEPLIHFLLIGLSIFILYGIVGESESDENTIVFNSYDLNNILSKWELQWKRPPTEEELKNSIEQNIKQELFYQEALKMNLDHNDEIIKRRLSQKMEFLSNDLVNMQPPTEEELKAFYNSNKSNYLSNFSFTVHQITFSYDNHNSPLYQSKSALNTVNITELESLKNKGDNMPYPSYFENSDENQIRRSLGKEFVDGLKKSELNTWIGPIKSGFGYHLVYITDKKEPEPIPFQQIKDRIQNDFNYQRQQEMDASLFNEIKKQYTFAVDLDIEEFDPEIIKLVDSTLNNN